MYIAHYAKNALKHAEIVEFIDCIKAPVNQTSAKVIALLEYIFQLRTRNMLDDRQYGLLSVYISGTLEIERLDDKYLYLLTLMKNNLATEGDIKELDQYILEPSSKDPRKNISSPQLSF